MQSMRGLLAGLGLPVLLASCGVDHRAGDSQVAPCAQPPGLAAAPLPQEQGVYRAGPVTLAIGEDLAQQPRRPSGSDAIVVVEGGGAATLRVESASRGRFALEFANGKQTETVHFPACGGRLHRFGGGVSFAGAGCVRLRVTPGGEMLIPVGDSLRGCSSRPGGHRLSAAALPYLGVACGVANVISCNRVGVGVRLRQPATLITVQLAGRTVTLSPPSDRGSDVWLGYLDDAGLGHGPLAVKARGGHWYGEPPVTARVVLTAFFADGTIAVMRGGDSLYAGFG